MNDMQILCFLKAAQLLSFTEAAAALHISQPAFSRNIAVLENEWEVLLFRRNNKQKATQLTPAGQSMYDGLRPLVSQYDRLLQAARSVHAGKAGTLSIGLISSDRIDERSLAVLDRFQGRYPEVTLYLRRGNHSELVQWLYDGTVDLAFCLEIDVSDKAWVSAKYLYSIDSVLILTASHPLLRKAGPSLSDFRDEIFLNVSSKESPALNSLLARECEKAGFTPKTVEAADISEQIIYLEAGRGVAIGSVNNTAGFSKNLTMLHLPELHPMGIAAAHNINNHNPCIGIFHAGYEPIE